MTLQGWIAENIYAPSTPRRLAAFTVKLGIEGLAFVLVASVSASAVYGVTRALGTSLPSLPRTIGGLTVFFAVVVGRAGWCLLTTEI